MGDTTATTATEMAAMIDRETPSTSWSVWAWQAYRDGRLVEAPAPATDAQTEAAAHIAALTAQVAEAENLKAVIDALSAVQRNLLLENKEVRAEAAALRVKVARLEGALQAVERLAIKASIASCTCYIKPPEITFHNAGCRYVQLGHIITQCEDARAALTDGAADE